MHIYIYSLFDCFICQEYGRVFCALRYFFESRKGEEKNKSNVQIFGSILS